MTTEQHTIQPHQSSLFEFFIEGLSSEHPNFFQLLHIAENVGAGDIYNDAFDAISKTGIHNPDFCRLVIHYPEAFNEVDYGEYIDEFLNNELVPNVNHAFFSKALTIIWPTVNKDYLLKVLTSVTSGKEVIVCNAASLLMEIYPLLCSVNTILVMEYIIHGLEHELAETDDPLNENTLLKTLFDDLLHFAFPKCSHINTLISNYFSRFIDCNNPLLKLLYEKILIAAISTLKKGDVPLLFKEFEKAYQQYESHPSQLISLLKFIHALPLDNDEIAKHVKYFFSLLQQSDFIIKQEALKIVMKHFKSISAVCPVTDLFKLIDCALVLEEHFPEEFLRSEIQLISLERFSENLTPLQNTIAASYLISILKEPAEKNTVLFKSAAVRMLQIVCFTLDNEALVNNQLLDLLNYAKANYGAISIALSTGILSLPALVKTQPPLSTPLLKTYRKHLTLFFTRFNVVTDDRGINELCYDFELFYDSNALKQILSLFIMSLQQKNTSLQELHPWRMLLVKRLISTPFNQVVIDSLFTLLITLHHFEHDRDKEEYALALLQYIKNCHKAFYRHAAIELLASVISLIKTTRAVTFLYKTLLTEDFISIPEIHIAIIACLKCLTVADVKNHLVQALNNVTQQQALIATQKLSLCLKVLREFPSLLTIEIIKTYLEPNLSSIQQQYVKLAYRVLNIKACASKQTTSGIEFFSSAVFSKNTFNAQNDLETNPSITPTKSFNIRHP